MMTEVATEYFYIKIVVSDTELAKKIFTQEFYGLEDAHIFILENDTLDIGKAFGTTDKQMLERVSSASPQMGGATLNKELPFPYRYVDFMYHAVYERIYNIFTSTPQPQPQPQNSKVSIPPTSFVKSVIETPLLIKQPVQSTETNIHTTNSVVYIFIKINPDTDTPVLISEVKLNYKKAELLAKSICRQIQIYSRAAIIKFPVPTENNVYYVNGQFLLLDYNLSPVETEPRTVGEFLQKIIPTNLKLKDTKLNYFMERCLQENKLFWI
jgi:hypothetical protein